MKVDIVFDGPPGPESGRFVEVEDMDGAGVAVGKWVQRPDGYWVLRIDVLEDVVKSRQEPGINDPIVTTCQTCEDPIWLQDATGRWVDMNGLESCAPLAEKHAPQGLIHGLVMLLGDGWWGAYHFEKGRLRGQALDVDPWWGTLGDAYTDADHAKAALRKRHGEPCLIEVIDDEQQETVWWTP